MKRGTELEPQREGQADPLTLIALEEELHKLKTACGIPEKETWWMRLGDFTVAHTGRTHLVNRKKYIKLAVSCGWLCGSHRFYAGQKFLGILYLLFFWTGIPFAMTMVDLMIALPKNPDKHGMIEL